MNLTPLSQTSPLTLAGELRVRCESSWDRVNGAEWNALGHGFSPFLRAGFLQALEQSASVGAQAGWEPHYVLVEHQSPGHGAWELVGACAAYKKDHSYGEYIFDWGWARGARQAGLAYYPKLVVAAPMTPATGERLLISPRLGLSEGQKVRNILLECLLELAQALACQSVHGLFLPASELPAWKDRGFLLRDTYQFHWYDAGYKDFAGFLGALNARRRKQIRKERKKAQAGIDEVQWVSGDAMTSAQIELAYSFYLDTVRAYGSTPYLNREFFELCPGLMGDSWQFALARKAGEPVAGALFFEGDGALYGRYWGAREQIDCLHFELAYYQGIDRCLTRGLHLFEAGAQGQHKLLRGFLPSPTYSAHWMGHQGLHHAVQQALRAESQGVRQEMQDLIKHGQLRQCDP